MFKIGDKVKCIDASQQGNERALILGQTYIVSGCDPGFVRVGGVSGEWVDKRFTLVSEASAALKPSGVIERSVYTKTYKLTYKSTPSWVGDRFEVDQQKRLMALCAASRLLNKTDKALLKRDINGLRAIRRGCGPVLTMTLEHIKTKKSMVYSTKNRVEALNRLQNEVKTYRNARRRLRFESKWFKGEWSYNVVGGVMTHKDTVLTLLKSKASLDVYRAKRPKTDVNHVGIELEFVSNSGEKDIAHRLAEAGLSQYVELKGDGSIRDDDGNDFDSDSEASGHELCILAPEDKVKDIVRRVVSVLHDADSWVNSSCGFHVHIDCRQRDVETVYNNLCLSQGLLYRMNPKSRASGRWCKRSKRGQVKGTRFKTRYKGVNPMAYREHKTIEVRIHCGTLNADKVNNWVELLTKIADQPKLERFVRSANALRRLQGVSADLCRYAAERVEKFKREHMSDVQRQREAEANAAASTPSQVGESTDGTVFSTLNSALEASISSAIQGAIVSPVPNEDLPF